MKLFTPRSRGPSVWGYSSAFGGGLVAGDQTRLDLQLGPDTRSFVSTQASTKVYRNPVLPPCRHETHAVAETGSLLVFAPEPVQLFAQSSYIQQQRFYLASNASLALVDWISSGRSARGERWAFTHLGSRNEIFRGEERELVFLDSLQLDSGDGDMALPHRCGRFNCFALLVLLGPLLRHLSAALLQNVAAQPVPRRGALVCSASPLREGAILRMAGEEVEAMGREIHRHLRPLCALLGDDPWSRKW
jgi:urease accessory protein